MGKFAPIGELHASSGDYSKVATNKYIIYVLQRGLHAAQK